MYAIKKVKISTNSKLAEMLEREHKYLSLIDHKNIVRLEAHIQTQQYKYFVFELCKGGTLKSLLDEHGTLPLCVIRHYAMELIQSFEAMQQMHLVHRDIKPANILLDNTFHVVLADFGLVKQIDELDVYRQLKQLTFDAQP